MPILQRLRNLQLAHKGWHATNRFRANNLLKLLITILSLSLPPSLPSSFALFLAPNMGDRLLSYQLERFKYCNHS